MSMKMSFDYLSTGMMEVFVPVTKKYLIKMVIQDRWLAPTKGGLYMPDMDILHCDRNVTNFMIQRNADQTIQPTVSNLITMVDVIFNTESELEKAKKEVKDE